jgi:hypothetical protein
LSSFMNYSRLENSWSDLCLKRPVAISTQLCKRFRLGFRPLCTTKSWRNALGMRVRCSSFVSRLHIDANSISAPSLTGPRRPRTVPLPTAIARIDMLFEAAIVPSCWRLRHQFELAQPAPTAVVDELGSHVDIPIELQAILRDRVLCSNGIQDSVSLHRSSSPKTACDPFAIPTSSVMAALGHTMTRLSAHESPVSSPPSDPTNLVPPPLVDSVPAVAAAVLAPLMRGHAPPAFGLLRDSDSADWMAVGGVAAVAATACPAEAQHCLRLTQPDWVSHTGTRPKEIFCHSVVTICSPS